MTWLRTWLLGTVCASMLISLLSAFFPSGKYKTLGNFLCGLLLLLVMLRPLLGAELPDFSDLQTEIDLQTEEYAAAQTEELDAVISDKTASYIEDKASSMGLQCHAEVACIQREGVPFPAEVWLDIPRDAALAQLITKDLTIDADHQHWQEVSY